MRKRAWLVAGMLAAAALAPAGSQGAEVPVPTYQPGIAFNTPVRMNYADPAQVGGPGEPSIKVDAAGTIYVAGVCCVGRGSPAWYSKDDGKTFRYLPSPGDARQSGIAAEGDFVVDDADGVYFSDMWVPSIFFTRWSGHGDTWEYTNDTVTVLPGPAINDRPWLAYSHGAIYLYVNHYAAAAAFIGLWKSTDGGHTWQKIYDTIPTQRYFPGMIAADPNGSHVYLFGGRCGNGAGLCAAVSADNGATWTEHPAGTAPRGAVAPLMVSVDVDEAGNVYGTFADINASGCDVYLAVSSDHGSTWRQYKVNPNAGCATFPWVSAGDDGRVALTWYYNAQKRHQDLAPASSEWKLQAAVVTDATSDAPMVTHGTLDRVIHRGPLGRELWDFQQIDIGPDGRFHIAFAEDALAPCSGTLSTQGSVAGYQNMCTDWVSQSAGPRARTHAGEQTSLSDLQAQGGAGSIAVSGRASFGRSAPAEVVGPLATTNGVPGFELRSGTVVRPTAGSRDLVFQLNVQGLPEALQGSGQFFSWPFKAAGKDFELRMTPRPWRFEVCTVPTQCTRVRGDTDAGSDRLVARVPMSVLGVTPGDAIAEGTGFVEARLSTVAIDRGDVVETYTIPGARVELRVLDDGGADVASAPASLSPDLSSFEGTVGGLDPGTYTVEAEACFATNCATVARSQVTVA